MSQIRIAILLSLYILLLLFLSSQLAVAASEQPKRIISLAPNITEILFAMGLGDRIAGVTSVCDFPEETKKKTKVGGMSNPSLEAVVSLRPDIVIMTTDGNPREFEERLRSLRIKTYVFRARQLSELPRGIRDLGMSIGAKEKADVLAKNIETSIDKFRVKGQGSVVGSQRVLFIVWPEPLIVAGADTAIDDAITLLGFENIAAKARGAYPKYSVEEILHNPPDIIMIGKGHADMRGMSKDLLKKLSLAPAVRNGKVFFLSDNLYRLGPRVVWGIEEMARCMK